MLHRPGLCGALLAVAQLLTVSITLGLGACGGAGGDVTGGGRPGSEPPAAQARAIYSGSTSPPAAIGSTGDFFLDFSTGALFGPKTADGWPAAAITLATLTDIGVRASLRSGFDTPAADDGVDGDFYLDLSNGTVYGPKAQGAWAESGVSLVGSTAGSMLQPARSGSLLGGSAAPSPAIGANGDFYIQAAGSSVTLFGPKENGAWPGTGTSLVGPEGPQGREGRPGSNGMNATSILAGSGGPGSADGAIGDLYFDVASATLYGPKTTSGWPARGIGLTGSKGDKGNPGQPGSPGQAGPPGRSVLSGTGVPDDTTLGVDGDFYLDIGSATLYGPKANGVWPGAVSLRGLRGQEGKPGTDGIDGRNGIDGATLLSGTGAPGSDVGKPGDLYLDTSAAAVYGPRRSEGWLSSISLKGGKGAPGLEGPAGPVAFFSHFLTPPGVSEFFVPISGVGGANTGNYILNATTMPSSCSRLSFSIKGRQRTYGGTWVGFDVWRNGEALPDASPRWWDAMIIDQLASDELTPFTGTRHVSLARGDTVALRAWQGSSSSGVEVTMRVVCE